MQRSWNGYNRIFPDARGTQFSTQTSGDIGLYKICTASNHFLGLETFPLFQTMPQLLNRCESFLCQKDHCSVAVYTLNPDFKNCGPQTETKVQFFSYKHYNKITLIQERILGPFFFWGLVYLSVVCSYTLKPIPRHEFEV